jgi:hypothetical protein
MEKEKKQRAEKYEEKIKHNLSFNQIMKIAANPNPKPKPEKKSE